jgi:hypothetical protein
MSHTEAMTTAGKELAIQRFLMTSRAYREAFDARVAELVRKRTDG